MGYADIGEEDDWSREADGEETPEENGCKKRKDGGLRPKGESAFEAGTRQHSRHPWQDHFITLRSTCARLCYSRQAVWPVPNAFQAAAL